MKKSETTNEKLERLKAAKARQARTQTSQLFFSPLSQPPKRTPGNASRYAE